jgi:predicted enzyme related to lactoylglutathione lyase/ketosteroid isomerase-like protein
MKPTYFDLTVRDLDRARVFFEQVFDWRFERFEMPYEYYRIQAGPVGEPGIDGGMGSVKDAPLCEGRPMSQVTIAVVRLDDVLSRVQAGGGRIVEPKMPIPGIGWYATCAEPGGLLFGVIQGDEDANPPVPSATGGVVGHIVELEERALRRWCSGDPSGFLELCADDVVYFDPFQNQRIDGLSALATYYESLRGKVGAVRFELLNPHVQVVGEAAVLTFNFVSWGGNEDALRWNCTEVFRLTSGSWKLIQTHWSFTNAGKAQVG